MLANHLQQILLSAEAIAELPFPPPKIFTNALLHPHDITTLIRDTEAYERALFTIAPPESGSFEPSSSRKSTIFRPNNADGENTGNIVGTYRGLRPTTAVGRILGGDMMDQIRKGTTASSRDRTEVDVDLLLRGAEKLCTVYPIHGATEKINSLRACHEQLTSSIERYEARLAKQTSQLDRMNRRYTHDDDDTHYDEPDDDETPTSPEQVHITAEDIEREEEEMRELEKKKRGLLDRVDSMERDLGGLLR
ncbi:hypothetical protein MMC30_007285 [Trapelia coarctata]|nr:hypothetical protein [Trapelia coarctata]